MTTKTLIASTFALLLAACGSAASSPGGRVAIQADLSSLAARSSMVVTVEANPASVITQLAFDAETGHYTGNIELPAGLQFLTVAAQSDTDGDGVQELVAFGSAEVTVSENQTSAVMVLLVDLSPPPPVPDHSPIITSAGLSNRNPLPGEPISVWVSAVDVDEDLLTYRWDVGCNAGTVTVDDPFAATTTITVDAAATCTVSVSVFAAGKQVWASMRLQVGSAGAASIEIGIASAPVVTQVTAYEIATSWACTVDRAGDEATCPDALGIGAIVHVVVTLDAESDGSDSLLDACGTTLAPSDSGPGTAHFVWNVSGDPGVCLLTASVTRNGRTDSLPVALLKL